MMDEQPPLDYQPAQTRRSWVTRREAALLTFLLTSVPTYLASAYVLIRLGAPPGPIAGSMALMLAIITGITSAIFVSRVTRGASR